MNTEAIRQYLLELQDRICSSLEQEDGTHFKTDEWSYGGGEGGGRTRILAGGEVIEQGGVNFSHIKGEELPSAAIASQLGVKDSGFEAMGVSLVIHPYNPIAPTAHMNIRFFRLFNQEGENSWWFGGGFDLTPYFPFDEDVIHWHRMAKRACDPFGETVYPRFKKWCDDYFYVKHRQETRGVGGIFFDQLNQWGFEKSFQFLQSVGDHFLPAYLPILSKRNSLPFHEHQREFQKFRRGRYVEFNLVYDRGTHFGLQSSGRTESILMSLPPEVSWHYELPEELKTYQNQLLPYLVPKEWLIKATEEELID